MNIMHEQVKHLKFGTGMITAQDSSTVTVEFSEEQGSRKFLYPSAFISFLNLCDPAANARMSNELRVMQALAETQKKNRLAEEEKQRSLLEQKTASRKRAPAKKRLPKKALTEKSAVTAQKDIS